MDKSALLLEKLRQRTQSSLASGGDGFVFASMLVFDVGLMPGLFGKCWTLQ